jgi:hypothetical protein
MDNTERLVTWGLLALIAYELYRPPKAPGGLRSVGSGVGGNTPAWVQQLSNLEQYELVQEYNTNNMSEELANNLFAIPQGPGGTATADFRVQADYFSPTRGIFANCG